MTDHARTPDQAERIRRLQARRAVPSTETVPVTAAKARRRHPAAATRWLLGGLSVASFFTIAGTVAVANGNRAIQTPTTNAPAASTVPAAPVGAPVATPKKSTPTDSAPVTAAANPAPAPHTTTRGS